MFTTGHGDKKKKGGRLGKFAKHSLTHRQKVENIIMKESEPTDDDTKQEVQLLRNSTYAKVRRLSFLLGALDKQREKNKEQNSKVSTLGAFIHECRI